MISKEELSECIDWKYNSRGSLETRKPIVKYTDTACDAGVVSIGSAVIDGTIRTLVGDSSHNVYYLDDLTPKKIGTAAGTAEFLSYNNICLVLDGSYVKYLDGISSIKMAYDTGTNIYTNISGSDDGAVALSAAGVGCVFTTPVWDAGFTMPPFQITAKVIETTPGSGSIEASFYDVVGTAEVAAVTFTGSIPDVANFIEILFTASDITTELKPNTQYRVLFKGANVSLEYTTVTSGGTLITAGSTQDTTKTPIIEISPGLPPKAKYGIVSDVRPFLWGDVDNPGWAHYGKLTHLEWGYVSSVDENRNSYEIGALEDLYGDLWAYGTEAQPYLATLIGDTESDWVLKKKFQKSWARAKATVNVGNDVFSGSSAGVSSLYGVQEYGDVRTRSESDNIKNKINKHWVSTSFCGYYPQDGQYWLYMPGYSKIFICHTKHEFKPWTEYSSPIVPTCFEDVEGKFLIGCADKFLYILDDDGYKDLNTTQIKPSLKTSYIELPFTCDLTKIQFVSSSLTGAGFDLDIFKNGNEFTSEYTYSHVLSMSDSLTIDDLTMDIDDMTFIISPQAIPPKIDLNIEAWSFQLKISEVTTAGQPVYFNGMFLKYVQLED